MTDNKFEWTDELVKEFILKESNKYGQWCSKGLDMWFEKFKKEKLRQPLFTTSDGKPIYEGDKYFIVDIHFTCLPFVARELWDDIDGVLARFSAKEAAERYIIENRPCLSVNDICAGLVVCPESKEKLIGLVKYKLNPPY